MELTEFQKQVSDFANRLAEEQGLITQGVILDVKVKRIVVGSVNLHLEGFVSKKAVKDDPDYIGTLGLKDAARQRLIEVGVHFVSDLVESCAWVTHNQDWEDASHSDHPYLVVAARFGNNRLISHWSPKKFGYVSQLALFVALKNRGIRLREFDTWKSFEEWCNDANVKPLRDDLLNQKD